MYLLGSTTTAIWKIARQPGGLLTLVVRYVLPLTLLISLSANAWQHYQMRRDRQVRLTRNLVRTSTQNGIQVKDSSLRKLSRSTQQHSPRGLTTDEVARQLESSDPPLLIDVRENEEYQATRIAGVRQIRYPDVLNNPEDALDSERPIVFLCYSGNRSGELAEIMAGLDPRYQVSHKRNCFFMVGGYEKWWSENRPLRVADGVSHPRDILNYANRDRLLDTAEVEQLFATEDVMFLDARYRREFAAFHLPNSRRITLRALTSDKLEKQLAELPRNKKFIGLGFDKRSSFCTMLLGAKVTERGRTWLGRYTVPHEFMPPKPTLHDSDTTLAFQNPTAAVLGWVSARGLSLGWSIVAVVVLIRLAMLPVTWRAQHSDAIARRVGARYDQINRRRRGRSRHRRRKLYQRLRHRAGVTPAWGFVSSIIQLVVFVSFALALRDSTLTVQSSLIPGWIDDLSIADSLRALPIAIGLLLGLQMWQSEKFKGRLGMAAICCLAVFLVALTWPLQAALTLAIVTNLVCTQIQTLGYRVMHRPGYRRLRKAPTRPVPLCRCDRYEGIGRKATRLGILMRHDATVQDGFVLSSAALNQLFAADGSLRANERWRKQLLREFDQLATRHVAVRSAVVGEDSVSQSFAGLFDTRLSVTREKLFGALQEVMNSFHSSRSQAYSDLKDLRPCILVQAMASRSYAGVLSTQHPRFPCEMAVEMVEAVGEQEVCEQAEPLAFTIGRYSGMPVENEQVAKLVPYDLLHRFARLSERLFDSPQEIEWASTGDRIVLLQTRDITTSVPDAIESERQRVARYLNESKSTLRRVAYAELVAMPTESTVSLLKSLVGPKGAVAKVRNQWSMRYCPSHVDQLFQRAFGRLFVDSDALDRLFGSRSVLTQLRSRAAMRRIMREERQIAAEFQQWIRNDLQKYVRLEHSRDLSCLQLGDLGELLQRRVQCFVSNHYVPCEQFNLIVAFYETHVLDHLAKHNLPATVVEQFTFESVTGRSDEMIRAVARGAAPLRSYLIEFGHRAVVDYELSSPRFHEAESPIRDWIRQMQEHKHVSGTKHDNESDDTSREYQIPGNTRQLLSRFGELTALKETSRHHALKSFALIREVLREIGRRTELCDQVFHLRLSEIGQLTRNQNSARLMRNAADRAEQYKTWNRLDWMHGIDHLDRHAVEQLGRSTVGIDRPQELLGTWATGRSEVTGRVRTGETSRGRRVDPRKRSK